MRAAATLDSRRARVGGPAVGLVAVALYAAALAWAAEHTAYDLWGGLLVAPVLTLISVPLLRRAAAAETDARIARLIPWAFATKLAATVVRHTVSFETYERADARGYAAAAEPLAELFRHGEFAFDIGKRIVGTGFIEIVTGFVYALTGPTTLGGFLVFSWLAFWGLYLFFLAVRTACPDVDHRRYALLLFFLPSLLFWPSSIGKESWMVFTLGVSAYGVARVLTCRRLGWPLLGIGLLGVSMVRPHMSALVCAGLLLSYLLRRPAGPATPLGPLAKLVGVTLLLVVSVVVIGRAERYFGVEGSGVGGVEEVFNETERRSTQGGSSYEVQPVRNPLQLPAGSVTVLFRPFPFETSGAPALVASAEGVALLAVFAASWRRLAAVPKAAMRNPYVAFALVYSVLFVVAFSNVGNFGILTRQRAQLFPLVLLVLAVPSARRRRQPWRARN